MTTIDMVGGRVPVLRFSPASGSGPAVVVIQEIFGVGDYIQARCRDLADAGYVVYAPDLYARLDPRPAFNPDDEDYVMQGVQASMQVDWHEAVQDVAAVLEEVRGQQEVTGKVALMGFCYGGGLAYNVAAVNAPDALVSFYGSALPTLLDVDVNVPSLHHFGTADAYIAPEVVAQIESHVTAVPAPVEFYHYDGAGHAFDNPHPMFHHAQAAELAWERTLDFLARTIRS